MIQNRRIALAFRLGALIFALAGVLVAVGAASGEVGFGSLMFYTLQSNILAVILFAYLAFRTGRSMKENLCGSVGFNTRLVMVLTVDLLVTMIVFWAVLAPGVPPEYLLTFDNITVHTITPLLCLLDYILFSEAGRLKYRDVYYVCIFPLFYVVFATIAGQAGYVFYYVNTTESLFSSAIIQEPVRAPYFFLDFDEYGIMAVVFIAALVVFFLILSHVIYLIDRKRHRTKNDK